MSMDGFKVLHSIMRSECDKFIVAMINANPAEPREVLAKQALAKAAAQFYTAVTNRFNEERSIYTNAPHQNDKPLDSTEGILDLGELAEGLEHVPNLLGEENYG